MSMDSLVHYLDSYGYMIIFIFLFFGIVGIPAPEESLLFLIGILSEQQDVKLFPAVLSAFAGSFTGMLAAFRWDEIRSTTSVCTSRLFRDCPVDPSVYSDRLLRRKCTSHQT